MVRQRTLTPLFVGSIPTTPASKNKIFYLLVIINLLIIEDNQKRREKFELLVKNAEIEITTARRKILAQKYCRKADPNSRTL